KQPASLSAQKCRYRGTGESRYLLRRAGLCRFCFRGDQDCPDSHSGDSYHCVLVLGLVPKLVELGSGAALRLSFALPGAHGHRPGWVAIRLLLHGGAFVAGKPLRPEDTRDLLRNPGGLSDRLDDDGDVAFDTSLRVGTFRYQVLLRRPEIRLGLLYAIWFACAADCRGRRAEVRRAGLEWIRRRDFDGHSRSGRLTRGAVGGDF